MSGKALGIPNKENLLPVANAQGRASWVVEWTANGSTSKVGYVEPENWYTIDRDSARGVYAGVVMDMGKKVNLTHIGLICDNNYHRATLTDGHKIVQLHWSDDGVNWTRSYYDATSHAHIIITSGSTNTIPVYISMPRAVKVKARYWKISLPYFRSTYDSNVWNIKEIYPCDINALEDVVWNATDRGVTQYDLHNEYPNNNRADHHTLFYRPNVCMMIDYGFQPAFVFTFGNSTALSSSFKIFPLHETYWDYLKTIHWDNNDYVTKNIPMVTKSGMAIGCYVDDYSGVINELNAQYFSASAMRYRKYTSWAVGNYPERGVQVFTNIRDTEIRHDLPEAPEFIMGIQYADVDELEIDGITHTDLPGQYISPYGYDEATTRYAQLTDSTITVDEDVVDKCDSGGAGLVAFNAGHVVMGSYVGTGSNPVTVDTQTVVNPNMVIIASPTRLYWGTFGVGDKLFATNNVGTQENVLNYSEGETEFIIQDDDQLNTLGVTYYWWAVIWRD